MDYFGYSKETGRLFQVFFFYILSLSLQAYCEQLHHVRNKGPSPSVSEVRPFRSAQAVRSPGLQKKLDQVIRFTFHDPTPLEEEDLIDLIAIAIPPNKNSCPVDDK